ncbi:hypothetical protein [Xanthocytophaga flava]|uniref:hypothetical protein n=1 Tax=Xanthocytophaga flava TaxID=3048013 RepID=UPI0028D91171|nr:hypothetical protein [Xanthocytophaga flavus]MDJ1466738.1 hypothetical protein [Xanthocytophaga flavus]
MKGRIVLETEKQEFIRIAWPSPALRKLIAYYFEVKSPINQTTSTHLYSIPSLHGLFCFSLNDSTWISTEQQYQKETILKGTQLLGAFTYPLCSVFPYQKHAFYIKLQPGVLEKLTGFLPGELLNAQSTPENVWKNELTEQIGNTSTFEQRIACAETYFKNHQYFSFSYAFNLIQTALSLFSHYPTQSIETIADNLSVSYRTLHRHFDHELVLSPKYCQKLIRFRQGISLYRTKGSQCDYSHLGYTDFSHFCREARQIALRAPSEI